MSGARIAAPPSDSSAARRRAVLPDGVRGRPRHRPPPETNDAVTRNDTVSVDVLTRGQGSTWILRPTPAANCSSACGYFSRGTRSLMNTSGSSTPVANSSAARS
jgi:hypothetical protein